MHPFRLGQADLPAGWRDALLALGDRDEAPLEALLANLPPALAAPEIWRAWSGNRSLFDYERKQRDAWDAINRTWLLPILWCCADQASWLHRYALAERLAKRAVARAIELRTVERPWAVLSYLSLARVYFAQDRLEPAAQLLDNLPPCDDPETRGIVALHRSHHQRRIGAIQDCFDLLRQATQLLGSVAMPEESQAADQAFQRHEWDSALQLYSVDARKWSSLRPGQRIARPVPLTWPCVPGLLYPWPVAFSAYTLGEVLERYLHGQGQMARCLRSLGRDDEARDQARQAKAVRATSAEAARIVNNQKTFADTISVRLTLRAEGRQPTWLMWDTARGELHRLSAGEKGSNLVVMAANGPMGEDFLRSLFSQPLGAEPLELRVLGRKAEAGQIEATTYALWVGFETGPPLYAPVVVG